VDKKRGDNPVKEILGKNYWEVGCPIYLYCKTNIL
jgi:hypothetical protein